MKITSPAFAPGEMIPKKYTCQGIDVNPPLEIAEIPSGTKSLALIVDDPDAPMGMWVHWVMYNIPVTGSIAERSAPGDQGENDFGKKMYGGPCPPSGTHRYFFKLYALDILIPKKGNMSKQDLAQAMRGHVLAEGQMMGVYKK